MNNVFTDLMMLTVWEERKENGECDHVKLVDVESGAEGKGLRL